MSEQARNHLGHCCHVCVNEETVSAICCYSLLPQRSGDLSHAIRLVAYELEKRTGKVLFETSELRLLL